LEANVKWFSVASPGPAGNFYFSGISLKAQGKMGMVFGVIDSPQPQHTVLAKKASYEIRR
jgi:hypothetical protein